MKNEKSGGLFVKAPSVAIRDWNFSGFTLLSGLEQLAEATFLQYPMFATLLQAWFLHLI